MREALAEQLLSGNNGDLGNWVDNNNGHNAVFVFDCTGLGDRYPVAIRYWCRVGTLDVEKIRGRTAVVSATSDSIEWPDSETSVSASPRVVSWDSADTQSSANWTTVEDLSWTQMDWMDCCYDIVLPANLARTAKYIKVTNVSYGHAREFEVRTPNVVIKVDPDHSDLVETRVINGSKYILIRAESSVEVNGVSVNIK